MLKRMKKTAALLLVSGTLGLASLSATADANFQPIGMSQCERDVRAWCYEHWQEYYLGVGYDVCVSSEWHRRCEDSVPPSYDAVSVMPAVNRHP
ncbi:MAG: hypothetical protein QOJ91_2169 [Sphingomonadales bacterium]|nr:hypothetical protein [Sphingomonadales bacterium]